MTQHNMKKSVISNGVSQYSISFVLPMYNERDGIEDTIEEIRIIARALTDNYEIVISDDGSTDGSGEIAQKIAERDPSIKVVRLEKNTKFGGALAAGLKKAAKDVIIYTDSDLPISLFDIKKSLPIIEDADIVTATSIVKKGENLKRRLISWGYNFLLRLLFNISIKDVNSGYKIYRKSILNGMEFISRSPFIDAEIFLRAKARNAKIVEYPLIFRPRRQGVSNVARISVIAQTFLDMIRFRMGLSR